MIIPIQQDHLGPERGPHETARAYRAFCYYRDMRPDRSLDKACKQFYAEQGKDHKSARRTGQWSKWSQQNHWVERAEAYDDLIDEETRNAAAAQRQELQRERSKFAVKEQQRKQNLVRKADLLLDAAFTASRVEVTQVKSDKVTGTKTTTKVRPPSLHGMAALIGKLNETANQAVLGVDSKDTEKDEPKKIERVVWIRAPKSPVQDPSESGQDLPQPDDDVDPLATEFDPLAPDSEKDKAA